LQNFSQKLYARLVTTFTADEGQTMAEYGIVLALITLAVVATLILLGGVINDKLTAVYNTLINAKP
jgi:Flp pilus assembly pilin Flp